MPQRPWVRIPPGPLNFLSGSIERQFQRFSATQIAQAGLRHLSCEDPDRALDNKGGIGVGSQHRWRWRSENTVLMNRRITNIASNSSVKRRTLAIIVGAAVVVVVFFFLAPVVYVPATSTADCNFSCPHALYPASHQSVSAVLFGIGMTQWGSAGYCFEYPWQSAFCK